jgi:diguanylate cyclase (GGDEF)-like protein
MEYSHVVGRLRETLPQGRLLPDPVWRGRHLGMVVLLWSLVPALATFALLSGKGLGHSALEVVPLVALAAAACAPWLGRRARATAAAFGLITCSALLVHLWEGRIEAHFAFFVVLALLMLYQDWLPFLLAIGYVVVHHGVLGAIDPSSVYDHPGGMEAPWLWALVHGGFVLAASAANMVAWHASEQLLHVREEARTDELTGLLNRRGIYDQVDRALHAARRDARPLGLILLDLDRFKEINDTFGHHVGDEVLRGIGARLRLVLPEATLARLSGDEFVAMLHADCDATLDAARRVLDALEQPLAVEEMVGQIGGSIGVASFPEQADTRVELLRYADRAMYRAKRRGSGAEVYVAEDDESSRERLTLAGELRGAIADDQLVLHYQPKADLATATVRGVEALVRWEHPQRGLLYPAAFIDLAEQHGLMRRLTLHVLELAMYQQREWRHAGINLPVAVNLSPANLLDMRFPADVAALLSAWQVPPGALQLEVTENTVMLDPPRALDTIARLSELGITFALDDFGTGYSSLAQLKRLPVTELKIDRSFVLEMTTNGEDAAIVRSTVDLARNLGLEVVAEGVETQAHWEQLAAFGCHTAQGYHLSRPLPADELTDWVRRRDAAPPGTSNPIAA